MKSILYSRIAIIGWERERANFNTKKFFVFIYNNCPLTSHQKYIWYVQLGDDKPTFIIHRTRVNGMLSAKGREKWKAVSRVDGRKMSEASYIYIYRVVLCAPAANKIYFMWRGLLVSKKTFRQSHHNWNRTKRISAGCDY